MGVIRYRSFPTDRDPWDGPAEIRAADTDDLLIMCAWYDSESPDIKASYKLPHHRADSKRIAWRGLTAAMGALLGARGGVDIPDGARQGVYNHLARHYREDFDEEPPELRAASMPEHKTIHAPAEFKANKAERTIEGYASIFGNVDLVGDIVAPGAFAKTIASGRGKRAPLLWQHNPTVPIGTPLDLHEDGKGLYFKDKLSKTRKADEALELVDDGVVDGVSIGFDTTKFEIDESDENNPIRTLTEIDLWEKSIVTFPANELARVTAVYKSFHHADLMAGLEKLFDARIERLIERLGIDEIVRHGARKGLASADEAAALKDHLRSLFT